MANNDDDDGPSERLIELTPMQKQDILLNHIILPHFLPQSNSPNFHQSELQLFDEMYKNVIHLIKYIPWRTVELFKSMHKIHHKPISTDILKENILMEINALQSGDTFATFVRRQNCTFIIYVPPNENIVYGKPENAIVATFPGRLHPNEVYKCDGDIEVIFTLNLDYSHFIASRKYFWYSRALYIVSFIFHSSIIHIRRLK